MNNEKDRALELLRSAAKSAKQLESDIGELVAMRAWEVLGYDSFSEMWEHENGFSCPTHVQVLAAVALRNEGMNTRMGFAHQKKGPNGHTLAGVGHKIGLPIERDPRHGAEMSRTANSIFRQLDQGVPPEHVIKGSTPAERKVIERFGARARSRPRRIGKSPDEFVSESFHLLRCEADQVAEIAREANAPKAEIYRQAVSEYLARHRASLGSGKAAS